MKFRRPCQKQPSSSRALTFAGFVDVQCSAQDANPNVQIQVLMDEKNRKIDAVRAERQALKDATIFYKIKAAEFKEYTQV